MDDEMQAYWKHVLDADQKSVEAFDKSLLTLSGGALGLSLVFVRNVVGTSDPQNTGRLLGAWIFWIFAISLTLASFYCSHRALRRTLHQIREGKLPEGSPGGRWSTATTWATVVSGIAFLIGLVLIVWFASSNL